ncbi:hypothetical protein BDZ85DRAFT_279003 [Elsinoe ampelina]|uniref:Uncharacterized protein n=1 Tax=Elsinoe ampelina TaxID=302913 RepID=A0A6A6GN43_9PEZI|nr:hypothetical protein BDZ85DRAFT_279003 [Elsinoe ampelina]
MARDKGTVLHLLSNFNPRAGRGMDGLKETLPTAFEPDREAVETLGSARWRLETLSSKDQDIPTIMAIVALRYYALATAAPVCAACKPSEFLHSCCALVIKHPFMPASIHPNTEGTLLGAFLRTREISLTLHGTIPAYTTPRPPSTDTIGIVHRLPDAGKEPSEPPSAPTVVLSLLHVWVPFGNAVDGPSRRLREIRLMSLACTEPGN